MPERRKIVARNRRARFDYELLDTLEAGIELLGPEVKSLRAGRASLQDAHAAVRRGQMFLEGVYIGPYEQAGRENPDPRRRRRLLLHRREIAKLGSRVAERGLTIVPLSIYFNERGRAKVELALVRGKRRYDKRQALREREESRELQRRMRRAGRSSP